METAIKTLVNALKRNIANDMHDSKKGEVITRYVLDAYNAYQEQERDGVDYIFNIHNREDLACCVDGGLTAKEIAALYNASKKTTPYFFFGVNHETPMVIINEDVLKTHLIKSLDEIIPCVVAYSHCVESYRKLYLWYIRHTIEDLYF